MRSSDDHVSNAVKRMVKEVKSSQNDISNSVECIARLDHDDITEPRCDIVTYEYTGLF